MNVVLVSSEVAPFARSGGLGDGVGALARALAKRGANVSVVSVHYPRAVRAAAERGDLDPSHQGLQRGPKDVVVDVGAERIVGRVHLANLSAAGEPPIRVYLIGCDRFFDRDGLYGPPGDCFGDNHLRFAFFSRATLEVIRRYQLHPHVVHCHDWQTALVPVYSEQDYNGYFNTLLTVHDTGFQGRFQKEALPEIGVAWDFYGMDGLEYWGDVNFLKGGILFASKVTTVSPTYADEIRSDPAYGLGLEGVLRARGDDVVGVLEGIDTEVWDPRTDALVAGQFSDDDLAGKARCKAALQELVGLPVRDDVPLVGMVSRLDGRSGIELVRQVLPKLASEPLQFVVLGTGEGWQHDAIRDACDTYPDRLAVFVREDEARSHELIAGADMLLKPSRYEPCGRSQLRALRYGTVPIVRATGGLVDTVSEGEGGVGFVFDDYTPEALLAALRRALFTWTDRAAWRAIVRRGMTRDHSWDRTARAYLTLYGDVVAAA